MADSGFELMHGNRRSRLQIEAVKKTAERAALDLAREQDESVSQLSQTFAQMTEDEALAGLEGRLSFIERQVERLADRRQESDRLVDSELAVMRARLEDTLGAFAGATQEHREVMALAERRLEALAADAERGMWEAIESMRQELSAKVEAATGIAPHLEARLLGEKRAFEEEASKRSAALDLRIGEATSDLADREQLVRALRISIEEVRLELLDGMAAADERALNASVHLESVIEQVRRRLVNDEDEWAAVLREAGTSLAELRDGLADMLGRVCALEAAAASERAARSVQLDGLDQRLALAEHAVRGAVTEVSELGLRCKANEAALEELPVLRALVEEQAGAIEYLKARVYQLGEQVDSLSDRRSAEDGTAIFWPTEDGLAEAEAASGGSDDPDGPDDSGSERFVPAGAVPRGGPSSRVISLGARRRTSWMSGQPSGASRAAKRRRRA